MKLLLLTLLSTFRLLFIPIEFQDEKLSCTQEELRQKADLCQDYYNREFVPAFDISEFIFEFAPVVKLSQNKTYYGSNYLERKDVQIQQAVREAIRGSDAELINKADAICLIAPGQDEVDNFLDPDSIYPQYLPDNKAVIVCELSKDGILCHELAHHFSLVDLYDTDNEGSGGYTEGLRETSLMDEACRNDVIPSLTAIELEMLGIGTCDTLKIGAYTIKEREYLKLVCDNKDEYYLIGNQKGSGLRIYYIDKSQNMRGKSDKYDRELSAAQRWQYNEVNARPFEQCARLVDYGIFTFKDGTTSSLILSSIEQDIENNTVSFKVSSPLTLNELEVFQDAAIIRWNIDSSIPITIPCRIVYKEVLSEQEFVFDVPIGQNYFIADKLKPNTHYSFTLSIPSYNDYSLSQTFTTKILNRGTKAYIYLSSEGRKENGSFVFGAKLSLRVFNADKVVSTKWFFNERAISLNKDGYFEINKNGVLKVQIEYENADTETIIKEIRL